MLSDYLEDRFNIGIEAYNNLTNGPKVTKLGKLQSVGGMIIWGENEELIKQWEDIQDRLKMEVRGQDMGKAGLESSETERDEAIKIIDEEIGRKHVEKWYKAKIKIVFTIIVIS